LDSERGGRFSVRPSMPFRSQMAYVDHTNVLVTRFVTESGEAALTDLMPVGKGSEGGVSPRVLLRKIEVLRGMVEMTVLFEPRFDYGRAHSVLELCKGGVWARGCGEPVHLTAPFTFSLSDGGASAHASLSAGESRWVVLRYGDGGEWQDGVCERALEETLGYWRSWVHGCASDDRCLFFGSHHPMVLRSELVLKMLTHADSGAIAAAATTSLPEVIGGVRNWDYRYAWIRDASFTVQALHNAGHAEEAAAYFRWVRGIRPSRKRAGHPMEFQIMYGLHGETRLTEETLEHLEGYRGSRPVRVGNAAFRQHQWDIYGELALAFYETTRYGTALSEEEWTFLGGLAEEVVAHWREPDSGIWEVRGGPRHFTYSKLMCWVALDRASKMARGAKRHGERPAAWERAREEIRGSILSEGYSEKTGSFVQSFGSNALDATSLLIPKMGLLPYHDPRVEGTIRSTTERLLDNGLVYRYLGEDSLPGQEGAFLLCTFWLVDSLALSGRVDEAEALFERVLARLGPLALLSEQVDPSTNEYLGNYPQAFSHIGLLNSALYLARCKGKRHNGPEMLGLEHADHP
jgi:GH15 family glucan-1,4-alpha-glucosidase